MRARNANLMTVTIAGHCVRRDCWSTSAGGGVWVLQRDGDMFVIREESIAPLLELCQR